MTRYPILLIIFLLVICTTAFSVDEIIPEEIYASEMNTNKNRSDVDMIIKRYHNDIDNRAKNIRKDRNIGPLGLSKQDIRLEKSPNGDYVDLVIRKKPYVNSILLTNYFWNMNKHKIREYGLRNPKFNWVNGNEKRLYKKTFIGKDQGLYFMVDSSPENDAYFGRAFRIRMPKYVVYGYREKKEVYGIIRIKDGVRINIRTFTRKYADYKGAFKNNPISLVLNTQRKSLSVKDHPVITKIKELLEQDTVAVYVQYESKNAFFKSFLVREENEKNYTEIGFSQNNYEHKRAILLEAFYKGGKGRLLRSIIYFRRDNVPKTYYITAVDKRGAHSVGRVVVNVPASDGRRIERPPADSRPLYDELDNLDNSEYWYNEGDF